MVPSTCPAKSGLIQAKNVFACVQGLWSRGEIVSIPSERFHLIPLGFMYMVQPGVKPYRRAYRLMLLVRYHLEGNGKEVKNGPGWRGLFRVLSS